MSEWERKKESKRVNWKEKYMNDVWIFMLRLVWIDSDTFFFLLHVIFFSLSLTFPFSLLLPFVFLNSKKNSHSRQFYYDFTCVKYICCSFSCLEFHSLVFGSFYFRFCCSTFRMVSQAFRFTSFPFFANRKKIKNKISKNSFNWQFLSHFDSVFVECCRPLKIWILLT